MIKAYLVGEQCGGMMEDPGIHFEQKEIVLSETPLEAERIYNTKHNCSFFYAKCLGEIREGKVTIDVKDLLD